MAVTYTYSGSDDDIVFDFTNEEINVGNGFDDLDIQELVNAIREAEYSETGITFDKIGDASGKNDLDAANGVQVGITLELLGDWVVYTEKVAGTFKVWGGNLLQTGGGDPFKENPLVTYINILSAASTIVTVSTGSGLSAAQNTQLMATLTKDSTVDSTTLEEIFEDLLARTSGKFVQAGNTITFYKRDNTTEAFVVELNNADTIRTRTG